MDTFETNCLVIYECLYLIFSYRLSVRKCFSLTGFSQPRWRGSKSVTPRPRGKYRVTLHHTSTDSKLKTPYASRKVVGSACFSAMGYPRVVNGRSVVTPPYNSLNDPHLSQYYAKKFGQVSGTPLVTQRSRPVWCFDHMV